MSALATKASIWSEGRPAKEWDVFTVRRHLLTADGTEQLRKQIGSALECGIVSTLFEVVRTIQRLPPKEKNKALELLQLICDHTTDLELFAESVETLFLHESLQMSEELFERLIACHNMNPKLLYPAFFCYATMWWVQMQAKKGEQRLMEHLDAREAGVLAIALHEVATAAEGKAPAGDLDVDMIMAAILEESDHREREGQRSTAALLRSAVLEHHLGFMRV